MCGQCRNFQSFLHAHGLSTDIHLTFVILLVHFSSFIKKKKNNHKASNKSADEAYPLPVQCFTQYNQFFSFN